jgi:uncharacterized Zn finger protein (UPF0148 family)
MRGVIQSRTGENGTCFRASLASLLNLRESQVPDFPLANQDPGVDKFLARYGLRYEEFPITEDNDPVGYHFILGTSPRGGEHAIVGKDGKPVWDPHPASDGTGQGLTKPERYGVLVSKLAKDAQMLPVKERLDETAYNLLALANEVLADSKSSDEDKAWARKVKYKYGQTAKDADPRSGVTKCQMCGAPLNGDDVAEVNGKVVCPDCADRRARLHRALDCVMDRARANDVSEQSLQVALTRAEKHVEAARNSVSLAVEARRNKGERLQSMREIKARRKLSDAHMEVYKAESALKDYRERN